MGYAMLSLGGNWFVVWNYDIGSNRAKDRVPNLVGVKHTSKEVRKVYNSTLVDPSRFQILMGTESNRMFELDALREKYGAGIEVAKAMIDIISGIDVGPVRLPITKLTKDKYNLLKSDPIAFGSVN